jgi:hypothetical protein
MERRQKPMRFRVLLIAMALSCAATGGGQQDAPVPKPAEPRLFQFPVAVAQGRRVIAFEFPIANFKYHLARNGLGNRTDGDSPAQPFSLHLSKGDYIRSLYYAEYQGDAILLIEVSNGAYGAGFIVRIGGALPGIQWKQTIPGINVGRGLLDDDFAYITAKDFVAKVSLRSGSYAWRHEDLENGSPFDAFDPPGLDGNKVLFPVRGRGRKTAVTVNKETGQLLSP